MSNYPHINQNLGPSKRGVYFLLLPFGGLFFFAFLGPTFCDQGLEAGKFTEKPNFIIVTVGAFWVALMAGPIKSWKRGGGLLAASENFFFGDFPKKSYLFERSPNGKTKK